LDARKRLRPLTLDFASIHFPRSLYSDFPFFSRLLAFVPVRLYQKRSAPSGSPFFLFLGFVLFFFLFVLFFMKDCGAFSRVPFPV